jgi:hypothetical protein
MGTRRIYGMPVMAFFRATDTNHPADGFWHAIYEGGEGPIDLISGAGVTVGGKEQAVIAMHYNYRLGTRGQSAVSSLTTHGYSGTWLIYYVFGPTNPAEVGPGDATATALTDGLCNIRVYTDVNTYTETTSNNRVWQIARMLTDKRWGYGYDWSRLDIQSFIDAAAWAATQVEYTDPFGRVWSHERSKSCVELIGKKVQQQIEDMCVAGRLSRPFLFNGKIHIEPLKALTVGELADCPVFTDEGESPNIIVEESDGVERSTVRVVERKSDLDLINQVNITFDDRAADYVETPLRSIEDVDAQRRAGVVQGDNTRKVNGKSYALLGVVEEAQATKLGWSILDLGPLDEGGLQNNLPVKFKAWFLDTLELHQEKVIKIVSSKLTKYGFTYFRVKAMERQSDLTVEIRVQAYNETYMATFETEVVSPPPGSECTIDSQCPPGYICRNGYCIPYIPPICVPVIGPITRVDGKYRVPIDPCLP